MHREEHTPKLRTSVGPSCRLSIYPSVCPSTLYILPSVYNSLSRFSSSFVFHRSPLRMSAQHFYGVTVNVHIRLHRNVEATFLSSALPHLLPLTLILHPPHPSLPLLLLPLLLLSTSSSIVMRDYVVLILPTSCLMAAKKKRRHKDGSLFLHGTSCQREDHNTVHTWYTQDRKSVV